MTGTVAFERFSARKIREAESASIERLSTVFDRRPVYIDRIGNAWSRLHYGGEFGLLRRHGRTAVSLVFIQTKDHNTGGCPDSFGGGATDKHLIFEGLSRVAADAVLAGAGTIHRNAFFSVWHPHLVSLRTSLGLPRHAAQIVVSNRGVLDFDALLFNVPHARVFLIAGDEAVARHVPAIRARPWLRLIRLNAAGFSDVLERLRLEEGIERISAIGGRFTATRLVDMGLAQDIYLTTTWLGAGEPGTPWYSGASAPQLTAVTEKQWHERASRVVFDHFLIGR
jgi:hypothetical protein